MRISPLEHGTSNTEIAGSSPAEGATKNGAQGLNQTPIPQLVEQVAVNHPDTSSRYGGGPGRNPTVPRTCDLLIKSQLLYQLSYRVPDIVPVLSPLGDVFVPDHYALR